MGQTDAQCGGTALCPGREGHFRAKCISQGWNCEGLCIYLPLSFLPHYSARMSTLHTTEDQLASRRGFLKRAGLGIGVIASASSLTACDGDREIVGDGVGTVRGTIKDGDGNTVEGVVVTLEGQGSVTTGADGTYAFTGVTARNEAYNLTVSSTRFSEFGDSTATVNVLNGGVFTQDFVLGSISFDFNSDLGVLNYAYVLEQLEADFYARVVGNAAFATIFSADEQGVLQDLAVHEAIHRDFLAAAISGAGGTPAPALEFIYEDADGDPLVDFTRRPSILAAAQTFEDLGVAAYNGAGQYIQDDGYLTIAGKIVSVEARHASVIAGLLTANAIAAAGVINASGLDRAFAPSEVLAAANPFIVNSLSAVNA